MRKDGLLVVLINPKELYPLQADPICLLGSGAGSADIHLRYYRYFYAVAGAEE